MHAAPQRSRYIRTTWLALFLTAILLGGAIGLAGCGSDGGTESGDSGELSIDLGTSEVTLPDPESLIETADWGEVPANQIGVTLAEGSDRTTAETLAEELGGSIVGEVEFISMFQIEFPGTSEADLIAALDAAAGNEGIALAFPNQQTFLDVEIWGVRSSTYDDPIYGGGVGNGYKAVGVDKAWRFIQASGTELGKVHVGIVDDGLYREGEGRMSEFGGDVKISFPDPDSGELEGREIYDDGTPNGAGSHGTGVATIIGADPDNGGTSGIAAPLGDKLEISMINQYSGKYGTVETQPDPNDPTKVVYSDGKTYTQGSFVAINKQIESGATIINCSWGNPDAHPAIAAAYKAYFEKLAKDHPDVLFVCSGGNTGTALDGSKRYPSGLALPNMITVGAVNKDGQLADYSSKKSDDYEVTLAAPGTDSVVGAAGDGTAVMQDGTSFAAPHVAAAAAMLRAINPKLSAGDIKDILVQTARSEVTVDDKSQSIAEEVGGRVLAIDQAVLKVINDKRSAQGLDALDEEKLELLGAVDAVAISESDGEWTVMGIVEAAGEGGVDLRIDVSAENSAIGGSTTQSLSGPGEVEWSLTLSDDTGIVTVTRLDTSASSVINIDQMDINGAWSGTFTIADFTVTDQEAASDEGCTALLIQELVGKAMPFTMDVTVDDDGNGTAVTFIDVSAISDGEASADPQTLRVSFSGSTITFQGGTELNRNMTANVTRGTDQLVMRGTSSAAGDGWSMTSKFTLTKPE